MRKLLALDQSSHITGYSIFEDNNLIAVNHFNCNDTDLDARLVKFRNKIIELIEQNGITEVVFENIQLQNNIPNNVKTFKILSEVIGVLQELLKERKIPYQIIEPSVWKSTFKFAGKGREKEKALAQQYVLDTYGIKCTEDEADSACIGAHIIKKYDEEYVWTF